MTGEENGTAPTRPASARVVALIGLILLAPELLFLLSLALAPDRCQSPTGDGALLELAVRAVERGDLAVGPYSRFGFRHPGPAVPLLLAPFHAALGGCSGAMAVGAALLSCLWLALTLLALRKTSDLPGFLVVAAAVAQIVTWMGPRIGSAWNPDFVLLPFLLTVVAAGAAATSPWWLVVAALAGSIAVQGHLAVAPGVLLAAAAGITGTVWVARKGRGFRSIGLPMVAAGAVAALVWLPVACAGPEPGGAWNLERILRLFVEHGGVRGVGEAFVLWSRAAASPFPPVGPDGLRNLLLALGPWAAVAAGLACATAGERRWPILAAAAAMAAGPPAAARIFGPPEGYLLQWMAVPVLLAWGFGLGMVVSRVSRNASRMVRLAGGVLLATVLAAPVAMGIGLLLRQPAADDAPRTVAVLGRVAVARLEGNLPRPVVLRFVGPTVWRQWGGILDWMDGAGRTPGVDPTLWFQVPRSFLLDSPPRTALVVAPAVRADGLRRLGGVHELGRRNGVVLAESDLEKPRVGVLPAWAAPVWATRWSGLGRLIDSGNVLFRWSDGDRVRLVIRLPEGRYRLRVECFAYPRDARQVVTVLQEGIVVGKFSPEPGRVFRWYPAGTLRAVGGLLRFELRPAWTVERKDALRSGDLARIGFAVGAIDLEPLDRASAELWRGMETISTSARKDPGRPFE